MSSRNPFATGMATGDCTHIQFCVAMLFETQSPFRPLENWRCPGQFLSVRPFGHCGGPDSQLLVPFGLPGWVDPSMDVKSVNAFRLANLLIL
jgi:hypothetical protein